MTPYQHPPNTLPAPPPTLLRLLLLPRLLLYLYFDGYRRGEIEGRTQIKFNGPKSGNGPKWLMKKETEIEKVIKTESDPIAFTKTEN